MTEAANGTFLRADKFVYRREPSEPCEPWPRNPGDTATAKFYATVFGKRFSGQQISLGYDVTAMQGQVTQGPLAGPPNLGTPLSALQLYDPSKPNRPRSAPSPRPRTVRRSCSCRPPIRATRVSISTASSTA